MGNNDENCPRAAAEPATIFAAIQLNFVGISFDPHKLFGYVAIVFDFLRLSPQNVLMNQFLCERNALTVCRA